MATLAHTARPQRESAAAGFLGRFWKLTQDFMARLLHRAAKAICRSRGNRAKRDISQYFADRGRPLTDAMEREIAERLMSSGWMRRG